MTSPSGQPTVVQTATNYVWAAELLNDAGLPPTPNNIHNITSWMVSEEPASNWFDRNNPLNASLGTSSSDGTGSYPSLNVAATQTATMLRQSNMNGIYQALANNAPFATFEAAVVASPWASGHYGGHLFSGTAPTVAVTGQTLAAGTPGSAGGTMGSSHCGGGAGVTIPVVNTTFFDGCQIKALVGGLLVGAGGVMLLTGFVLLAKDTAAGRAVKGLTPIGRASNAVSGARAPATAAAPQVEGETADGYDQGYNDAMAANPPEYSDEEKEEFKNTTKAAKGGDRGPIPRRNTNKNRSIVDLLNSSPDWAPF